MTTTPTEIAIGKLKDLIETDGGLHTTIKEALASDLTGPEPDKLTALKSALFSEADNEADETEGK